MEVDEHPETCGVCVVDDARDTVEVRLVEAAGLGGLDAAPLDGQPHRADSERAHASRVVRGEGGERLERGPAIGEGDVEDARCAHVDAEEPYLSALRVHQRAASDPERHAGEFGAGARGRYRRRRRRIMTAGGLGEYRDQDGERDENGTGAPSRGRSSCKRHDLVVPHRSAAGTRVPPAHGQEGSRG